MERIKAILPIFLAVFLCLSVSAVYAQGNEGYSEIYSAHLNGIPDSIVVEPGETVKVEIAFGYIAPASSRPEDRLGIIIGIDDSPRIYLLAGISYAEYLGGHDYVRTLDFGTPTKPGIYRIMSVSTKGYTTQGAEDLYRDCPDTRHIIGTIEVKDAASDESEEAYVKVQSVDLNGVYYSTKVEPGETITAEIFFGYVAPASPRPEDKVEIVIAFDYTPIGCLIEEIGLAEHLDGHDYVRTFEITAPTEPGLYYLTYGQSEGCTCKQAKLLFNLANTIGTVEVIEEEPDEPDDPDEWKEIYVNVTKSYTKDLNCFWCHEIAICQKGNDLRMEISAWQEREKNGIREKTGEFGVGAGCLSYSLEEDFDVHYDWTRVYGKRVDRVDRSEYTEIKTMPGIDERLVKGWNLFSGLSKLGIIANAYDLLDTLAKQTYYYEDKYSIENKIENLDQYFDYDTFSNERDVVVIPWDTVPFFGAVSTIRVDCPKMFVPEKCPRDIVFRVEYWDFNRLMRRDIGLSIQFDPAWTTNDQPDAELEESVPCDKKKPIKKW